MPPGSPEANACPLLSRNVLTYVPDDDRTLTPSHCPLLVLIHLLKKKNSVVLYRYVSLSAFSKAFGGQVIVIESVSHSVTYLFATPWTVAHQTPLSMGFSRQEYWSGLPFPLQGIFLTQESNPGLLHHGQILYLLSYEGSPLVLYN